MVKGKIRLLFETFNKTRIKCVLIDGRPSTLYGVSIIAVILKLAVLSHTLCVSIVMGAVALLVVAEILFN